jgi:hypothetical protein
MFLSIRTLEPSFAERTCLLCRCQFDELALDIVCLNLQYNEISLKAQSMEII